VAVTEIRDRGMQTDDYCTAVTFRNPAVPSKTINADAVRRKSPQAAIESFTFGPS
jgi:hypothetical protein